MKLLKRLVMLCLCLALVAASACAENVTELDSGEGDTYLYYDRTLPDGRLLLCPRICPSGTCGLIRRERNWE